MKGLAAIAFRSLRIIPARSWILLLIVLCTIGSGGVLLMIMQRRIRCELDQHMQARAQHLADAVSAAFHFGSGIPALQRAVAVLGADREVSAVIVVRASAQQIIAATHTEWIGQPVSALPRALIPANLHDGLERGRTGWRANGYQGGLISVLDSAMPADLATMQAWGDVRIVVVIDGRDKNASLHDQAARDAVRMAVLFTLIAMGLAWAVQRILSWRDAPGHETGQQMPADHGDRSLLVASVASAVAVKKAIDETATGMAVMDLEPSGGRIVHANPGFLAQCGYPGARHATGGWLMPLDAEVMDAVRSGRSVCSALRYLGSDGGWFDGDLHLDPVRPTEGAPITQVVGVIIDGGGERAIRARQADENRRLRSIMERLSVAVLVHEGMTLRFANTAAERLFRSDVAGKPLVWTTEDRIQPQDWERAALMWHMTMQDGLIHRDQFLLRRDDGSDFMADVVAESIAWGNGRAMLLTILDHEAMLTGDQGRKDQLAEFRRLFDEIPNPTWRSDAAGRGAYFNQAWRSLTGRSETEAVGDAWQAAVHPEDRDAYFSARSHAHHVRTPFNGVYRLRRFDNAWSWIAEHGTPCYEDGAFSGYLFSCYDITELKMAEQAIRGAHAESELLLSTIGSAIIGIDTNDRVMRCNAAAERMFGVSSSEIVGRTLAETGIRLDWADIFIAINECTTCGRVVEIHDVRYQRPGGNDGFLDIAINASQGAWGDGSERLGVVLLATDVTDRKVSESQRNQGVKLEAIGQLAAGIAHEINTPIQFVGDNLRFLRDAHRDLDAMQKVLLAVVAGIREAIPAAQAAEMDQAVQTADPDFMRVEIPKAIEQSLEGVERVATIIKAMKEFSHPEQGGKKPVDINKLILTTLTVSRNEYKYVADLELSLGDNLPAVPCVASEISQVVLNLVVNAAHAIADTVKGTEARGRITIATHRDDQHIVFTIGDTGGGIPERIRSRIFDPFFTTKEVGRGTGQGLYISRTVVVKKHGGSIDFTSETGKGTVFVVRLPLVEGGVP